MAKGERKPEDVARGKRLQAARENAGFKTASDGAKHVKVKADTYTQHENGLRGFKSKAPLYAEKFGVSLEWLWQGGPTPARMSEINQRLSQLEGQQQDAAVDLLIDTLDRLLVVSGKK